MNTQDQLKQRLIENLDTLHLGDAVLNSILFAYDLAKIAHAGQLRDDKTPYITHPVEGCIMMARDYCVQNPNLYIAFLLHDTGEDTSMFGDRNTLAWSRFRETFLLRVGRIFGKPVAQTALLLTKPPVNGVDFETKDQVMHYYLRNLTAASPMRDFAVFGKMIDRLHNLRSLIPDNRNKIHRQTAETEDLLLPLFEHVVDNLTNQPNPDTEEPDLAHKFCLVIQDIRKQLAVLKNI